MTAPLVIWDPRMLGYDLGGNHPLHPLRWELTWALVRDELDQRLRRSPAVIAAADQLRAEVLADTMPAPGAADAILRAFDGA